jgi:hypothetical protein
MLNVLLQIANKLSLSNKEIIYINLRVCWITLVDNFYLRKRFTNYSVSGAGPILPAITKLLFAKLNEGVRARDEESRGRG